MPARIESHAEPIPGYRLLERLGSGGFGEVWKAEAPGGLLKAVKFVYGDVEAVDLEGDTRASQELRALGRVKSVRHPFILSLERFDIVDHQLVIVMELADRCLWDRCCECQAQGLPGIPRQELLGYLREAAEALDLMHRQYDLLHLDIKPQNLFLVHNHVKVADFGLVKDIKGLVASVTGGITPVYAAPETFDGVASCASDLYSLAIVYQELLTGRRPFAGGTTRQIVLQHLQAEPNVEPLPPADRPVILRALAKDPKARFASCMELIQALDQATEGSRPVAVDNSDTVISTATPTTGFRQEPAPAREPPPAASRAAPPTPPRRRELHDGILFPAVVVGVGGIGRQVLQLLQHGLTTQHAAPAHVKLLAIDTDPQRSALPGVDLPEDLVVARLNRPSYYLRPRGSLPSIENWLASSMVYRIPRSLETSGLRALGRLALVDHYREIVDQLRQALEKVTHKDALGAAAEQTKLPLRSEWPSVYLVANLAGGTGGGMFLDLAYIAASLLQEMGFDRRDVVGLFLMPAVTAGQGMELALANSYAALRELRHYMVPGNGFAAFYETGSSALESKTVPFTRCQLLALPDEGAGQQAVLEEAAESLRRELFTPAGRVASQLRTTAARAHATGIQAFAVRALVSPRAWVIHHGTGRLCRVLLDRWLERSIPEDDQVLPQQAIAVMQALKLNPPQLLEQLRAGIAAGLGRPPERVFEEWVTPIQLAPQGIPSPDKALNVLESGERFFGRRGEATGVALPQLLAVARDVIEGIVTQVGPAVVNAVLRYVDYAGYRVIGAEALLRKIITLLGAWINDCDQEKRGLIEVLDRALQALTFEIGEFERYIARNRRGAPPRQLPLVTTDRAMFPMDTPAERLFHYLALRYQLVLSERLRTMYVNLREWLPLHTKELPTCRQRLTELRNSCGPRPAPPPHPQSAAAPAAAAGMYIPLLPQGCPALDDAAAQLCQNLTPEAMDWLDRAVQEALKPDHPALANLCVRAAETLPDVLNIMAVEAEKFLSQYVRFPGITELFVSRYPDFLAQSAALAELFQEAAPLPSVTDAGDEISIIALPKSPAGTALVKSFQAALPQTQVIQIENADEIALYREIVNVELQDLPQLGDAARQYYEMALGVESFTPHCRQDVLWQ